MVDFVDEDRLRADVESDEFDTEEDLGRSESGNSELTLPEEIGKVENLD